ncbi:hypothetical protein KR018_008643 [Drosophila ironensis]|nr:hypothetical protein KR018_008643 [Drosophila ironensis]
MEDLHVNLGEQSNNGSAVPQHHSRHRLSLHQIPPGPHAHPPQSLLLPLQQHHHHHHQHYHQQQLHHLQQQLHHSRQYHQHQHQHHHQHQHQHQHHHQLRHLNQLSQLSQLSQIQQLNQLSHLNHLNQLSQLSQLTQIGQLNQQLQQHHHLRHHHTLHHPSQHHLPLHYHPLHKLPAMSFNLGLSHKLAGDHQMQHLAHRMQMGLGLDLDLDLDLNLEVSSATSTSTGSTSDACASGGASASDSHSTSSATSGGGSSASASSSNLDQGQGHGPAVEIGEQLAPLSPSPLPSLAQVQVQMARVHEAGDSLPEVKSRGCCTTAINRGMPVVAPPHSEIMLALKDVTNREDAVDDEEAVATPSPSIKAIDAIETNAITATASADTDASVAPESTATTASPSTPAVTPLLALRPSASCSLICTKPLQPSPDPVEVDPVAVEVEALAEPLAAASLYILKEEHAEEVQKQELEQEPQQEPKQEQQQEQEQKPKPKQKPEQKLVKDATGTIEEEMGVFDLKPSASAFIRAANSKLNASATAYTMRGTTVGIGITGDGTGDCTTTSYTNASASPSASTIFSLQQAKLMLETSGDFKLNAGAAEFKPSLGSRVAGGGGSGGLLTLPGLLPAPHPLPQHHSHLAHQAHPHPHPHPHLHPHQHPHPHPHVHVHTSHPHPHPHPHAHAHAHPHPHLLQRYAVKQNVRWRKQPLPDLFNAVIALMRDLRRSVSYPEIISMLATRLQRPEVELKRHVPHTLHAAVNNGYLRKDGNRYTLLSESEQVEIMRRNQEAAQRAKELEKEPLSWRKR